MKNIISSILLVLLNTTASMAFGDISQILIKRQLEAVKAPQVSREGEGVIVAIIDTGINYQHKELLPQIYRGNSDYQNRGRIGLGYDFIEDDLYPQDMLGHGTHVAGIIHSVAPKAKILSLKIFDNNGNTERVKIVQAVRYAMMLGAKVINLSLGGVEKEKLNRDFFNQLIGGATFGQNVSIVVAAGNDYGKNLDFIPYFPANVDSKKLITVCSVNLAGELSSFSNIGKRNVDLCALGEDVYSYGLPGQGNVKMSGTSMAAPYVTGAIALMLSKNPRLTPETIKDKVLLGVDRKESLKDINQSSGILNISKTLKLID